MYSRFSFKHRSVLAILGINSFLFFALLISLIIKHRDNLLIVFVFSLITLVFVFLGEVIAKKLECDFLLWGFREQALVNPKGSRLSFDIATQRSSHTILLIFFVIFLFFAIGFWKFYTYKGIFGVLLQGFFAVMAYLFLTFFISHLLVTKKCYFRANSKGLSIRMPGTIGLFSLGFGSETQLLEIPWDEIKRFYTCEKEPGIIIEKAQSEDHLQIDISKFKEPKVQIAYNIKLAAEQLGPMIYSNENEHNSPPETTNI